MNSRENQTGYKQPSEYFDDTSFKTLYGGVLVTWVSTSAIVDVFGAGVDPKFVGFVIALIVALVGFFLKEERTMKKFVVTPFNGLLIYLTIMGGTSFLPPPEPGADTLNRAPSEQAEEMISEGQSSRSTFLTSWNPDRELMNTATKLERENIQLKQDTTELREVNTELIQKVDLTRESIRELQVSPEVRESLMRQLDVNSIQNFNSLRNSEINRQPE
jgi:hypothetical protein